MTTELKRGDTVLVPAGTEVHSMNPARKGKRAAGRTYRVQLWGVNPPQESVLLYRRIADRYSIGVAAPGWRQIWEICREVGFEYKYGTDPDLEQLATHLRAFPHPKIRYDENEDVYYYVWQEAKAIWAGSGGYWCSADLAAVKKATIVG